MLLPLEGPLIAYDLMGPENGPVVCMTHSLASDGGMWAEQVPPLLAAGFRVLRLDMRGHGGSDPVAGAYTMAQLADDVAAALDFLGIARCTSSACRSAACSARPSPSTMATRLLSAMWCDTCRKRPPARDGGVGAAHRDRDRGELAAAARRSDHGALVHRRLQAAQSRPLEANPRHHRRHHAGRLSRLRRRHPEFRLRRALPSLKVPMLVVCGAGRRGHAAGGQSRSPAWCPAAATRRSPTRGISPMSSIPTCSTAS